MWVVVPFSAHVLNPGINFIMLFYYQLQVSFNFLLTKHIILLVTILFRFKHHSTFSVTIFLMYFRKKNTRKRKWKLYKSIISYLNKKQSFLVILLRFKPILGVSGERGRGIDREKMKGKKRILEPIISLVWGPRTNLLLWFGLRGHVVKSFIDCQISQSWDRFRKNSKTFFREQKKDWFFFWVFKGKKVFIG